MLYILDRVGGEYEGSKPEIRISAEVAENETVRPDRPAMTLEQLRPYYQGVYFATVSMKKKVADEGLEGGILAKKLDGYKELVTEYNGRSKKPSRRRTVRVVQKTCSAGTH